MGTFWAIASGNVSVGANWNTGTVPGIDDDVYADGKDMVVDLANWSIKSLRTTQRTGGTVGGSFELNGTSYVATILGFYTQTYGSSIRITASAPNTINCIGDIISMSGSTAILITGNATIGIYGNQTLNKGAYNGSLVSYNANGGSLNYVGNLLGSNIYSLGVGGQYNPVGLLILGTGNVTHTGNINAMNCEGVSVRGTGTFTSTGVALSSATAPAIYTTGTNNVFYNGILQMQTPPSTTMPSIYQGTTGTGVVYFKGIAVNKSTTTAIYAIRMVLWSTGSTTMKFKNELGVDKNLYTADSSPLGNPAISDVRKGVVFGPSGELAGTLAVPPPESVTKGVPTDNTVGTCEVMNATDFLAELANSSDPLAVRLRNVATVQSTGDQLAELQ